MARFLMALDVGGGSGRCLLLDVETLDVFEGARSWSHPPDEGGLGADLDTDDIWRKLGEAASDAMRAAGAGPADVIGIAATSMRNTTVLVDDDGRVLFATPNQDARAIMESLQWATRSGKEVHQISGHWPSPLFTASRLMWLEANAPELLERGSKVLAVSDWVACKLGAGAFAERSQAGETLLLDQARGDWSYDLIESLGFDRGLFPQVVSAGEAIGELSAEASTYLGLLAGIPIAACGPDTQCGVLGSGATEAGDLCVIAGTTMPVQLLTSHLMLDADGRLWSGRHLIDDMFYIESNGLVTGATLEWLASIIYCDSEDPLAMLFSEAARSDAGAGGTYSTFGACTFDARSLSVPVGTLTMSHMVTEGSAAGRSHIARSLIEGIAFSAKANIDQLLAETVTDISNVKACAGMTRSSLWTQILSDVTRKQVEVAATAEASSLGAAICAGVAAGVFADLRQGANAVTSFSRVQEPGKDSEKYQAVYEGWSRTCAAQAPGTMEVSGLMTMTMLQKAAETPEVEAEGDEFRPRILVTASIDGAALSRLRELGEVEDAGWRETNRVFTDGGELATALDGFDVLVTEMDIVDFVALRNAPGLRAIVSCRVNPVNVDLESATAFGIPVMNTPGRNADGVADLTLAMMLMLARKLPGAAEFLKRDGGEAGDMMRMGQAYFEYQGHELWRKTVGIVGMGSVGRAVARRVRACGARAIFFDPFLSVPELAGATRSEFAELLSASHFVTLHAPASEETRCMMDSDAFSKMLPGAFFINTARASLVDYDALADALESDRLAGAALDVFPVEPPAADDRLVRDPKVIATPHLGGDTYEVGAHQGDIAAGQLGDLLRGQAPAHLLNPEVLEGFTWEGPRRTPSPEDAERLAAKEKPSMTS